MELLPLLLSLLIDELIGTFVEAPLKKKKKKLYKILLRVILQRLPRMWRMQSCVSCPTNGVFLSPEKKSRNFRDQVFISFKKVTFFSIVLRFSRQLMILKRRSFMLWKNLFNSLFFN